MCISLSLSYFKSHMTVQEADFLIQTRGLEVSFLIL